MRRRTVYSITPKGRRALEHWIGKPATGSRLESETLVKVMFATNGATEDLVANLRQFLEEVETRRQELRTIFHEYLRGQDPFPERMHINVVCYRLIWDYTETAASWAAWAIGEAERWPDVTAPPDRRQLMNVLEEALAGTTDQTVRATS